MSAPARGGFILIVAFLATAVFNYALGLLLAWVLPPSSFGQVSVLLAIFYLTAIVLDAGFPWTLARTVSRGGRLGEAEVAGAVRAALVGNLVFSVVIGILVLGIQRVGGFGMPQEFDLPVLVVAITLPVFAFNAVGRAILHGSMRSVRSGS